MYKSVHHDPIGELQTVISKNSKYTCTQSAHQSRQLSNRLPTSLLRIDIQGGPIWMDLSLSVRTKSLSRIRLQNAQGFIVDRLGLTRLFVICRRGSNLFSELLLSRMFQNHGFDHRQNVWSLRETNTSRSRYPRVRYAHVCDRL